MKKQNDFFRVRFIRSLLLCLAVIPLTLFSATPLDINSATAAQLAAVLSGVGEKKAQAIIAYREMNGDFMSVEDLSKVKGIGQALLERNKEVIQVSEKTD